MTGASVRTHRTGTSWGEVYAASAHRERVLVDGAELVLSYWEGRGDSSLPEVVLIHGGAAQRQWWDHLAPLVSGAGRVVALDLSGHGDSEHRDHYSLDGWSREVAAVADEFCDSTPLLVGHSMGGLVAVNSAQRDPGRYSAVLALDSPLKRTDAGNVERRRKIASRPVRSFTTSDEAYASYTTFPPSPETPPEVRDHIVRAAFRHSRDRWALKFDPRIYLRPQVEDDFVLAAQIPTWWVQAEGGFVDEVMAERIRSRIGPLGRLIRIPDSSHHLILEQPLATAWIVSLFVQLFGDRART